MTRAEFRRGCGVRAFSVETGVWRALDRLLEDAALLRGASHGLHLSFIKGLRWMLIPEPPTPQETKLVCDLNHGDLLWERLKRQARIYPGRKCELCGGRGVEEVPLPRPHAKSLRYMTRHPLGSMLLCPKHRDALVERKVPAPEGPAFGRLVERRRRLAEAVRSMAERQRRHLAVIRKRLESTRARLERTITRELDEWCRWATAQGYPQRLARVGEHGRGRGKPPAGREKSRRRTK